MVISFAQYREMSTLQRPAYIQIATWIHLCVLSCYIQQFIHSHVDTIHGIPSSQMAALQQEATVFGTSAKGFCGLNDATSMNCSNQVSMFADTIHKQCFPRNA